MKETMAGKNEIGKNKPCIMYFVDFSLLYIDAVHMLAKIRDVLHVFEENKEHVSVLWHQDPVLMRNLPVMEPDLWNSYKELMKDFEEAGYGIIDDTSVEDEEYFEQIRKNYPGPAPTPGEVRAIEKCDAFYGDGGYIANCFRNAGKPVMLQSPDILAYKAG